MSCSPYIEISLDDLLHNLCEIRRRLSAGVGVMAVVKDQAYGCGAIGVSRALERWGVEYLAVARIEEAQALRSAGIKTPILVMGECDVDSLRWGAGCNVAFSMNSPASFPRFAASGVALRLHIKFDTGMTRMGFSPDEADEAVRFLRAHPALGLEGAYTHCASADVPSSDSVLRQRRIFDAALATLERAGYVPRYVHDANTAALLRFGPGRCNLVRPGISLYGCKPDPTQDFGADLRPVASLKGYIVRLRKVNEPTAVSYGGTYIAPAGTHIATVNIGYAHGLPRTLSNSGYVLAGGQRYRIAGRVTMDYIMFDAGPEPTVSVGDEVIAMGRQGRERIDPDEIAARSGTIAYEVLCGLSAALDRRYLSAGVVVETHPAHFW